jgi:hypothetical protein
MELLDAFIHGAVTPGKEQRLSFRIGRHTALWGESLYFPNNGIAGGQAPVDTSMIERLTGYAGHTFFRPIGQVSLSWQPVSGLAIDLYDQFEWRPSRIGVPGGVVAAADVPTGGHFGMAPSSFTRTAGRTPASRDQYGVALKWHEGAVEYGVYALSFDAKTPVLHFQPGAGTFSKEFPEGIEIYGASLSRLLGPVSVGAEISGRRNMPLVTGGVADPPAGRGSPSKGDMLHAQLSWTYATPPLPGVPAGANWSGEVAANARLARTASPAALDLDRTRYAGAIRTVFEPQFFQALPRLDITLPFGLGYNFFGLSSVDPSMNRGTGDVSLGVTATFDEVWKAALSATHYLGRAKNVFPYNFVTAAAVDELRLSQVWLGEAVLLRGKRGQAESEARFSLGWLASLVLQEKRALRDIGLASLTLSFLTIFPPLLVMTVVDKVLAHRSYSTLALLSALLAFATVYEAVLGYARRLIVLTLGTRLDVKLNLHVFGRLLRLPLDYFERHPAGETMHKIAAVAKVREFLTGKLLTTFLDVMTLVVLLPFLFYLNAPLSWMVLGCSALIVMVLLAYLARYDASTPASSPPRPRRPRPSARRSSGSRR